MKPSAMCCTMTNGAGLPGTDAAENIGDDGRCAGRADERDNAHAFARRGGAAARALRAGAPALPIRPAPHDFDLRHQARRAQHSAGRAIEAAVIRRPAVC